MQLDIEVIKPIVGIGGLKPTVGKRIVMEAYIQNVLGKCTFTQGVEGVVTEKQSDESEYTFGRHSSNYFDRKWPSYDDNKFTVRHLYLARSTTKRLNSFIRSRQTRG